MHSYLVYIDSYINWGNKTNSVFVWTWLVLLRRWHIIFNKQYWLIVHPYCVAIAFILKLYTIMENIISLYMSVSHRQILGRKHYLVDNCYFTCYCLTGVTALCDSVAIIIINFYRLHDIAIASDIKLWYLRCRCNFHHLWASIYKPDPDGLQDLYSFQKLNLPHNCKKQQYRHWYSHDYIEFL